MKTITFIVEVEVDEDNVLSTEEDEKILADMEEIVAKKGLALYNSEIIEEEE